MILTCDIWIYDRAIQAKSLPNEVFQAKTTASVRHQPKLTPRKIRDVAFGFVPKQVHAP
jgi:hypothetical protein